VRRIAVLCTCSRGLDSDKQSSMTPAQSTREARVIAPPSKEEERNGTD
jgi:hypothetical protein